MVHFLFTAHATVSRLLFIYTSTCYHSLHLDPRLVCASSEWKKPVNPNFPATPQVSSHVNRLGKKNWAELEHLAELFYMFIFTDGQNYYIFNLNDYKGLYLL